MNSNGYLHRLKIWPKYFKDVLSGAKTFEFRKDDRDPPYRLGDGLVLEEWSPEHQGYSGESVTVIVSYIIRGDEDDSGSIPPGYCIMGIR